MQRFLEHAGGTLPEGTFRERVLLMGYLARMKARAMKDDTGQLAELDEEGYDLKRDQRLPRCSEPASGSIIIFFNAKSDYFPDTVRHEIVGHVQQIREGYG